MTHQCPSGDHVVAQHLVDADVRPSGSRCRVDDSVAVRQQRSAREIDGEGVKAARGSGGFRRLDRGVGGRCDHFEASLGQSASNVAAEKAARSGDQHAHRRSAHGGEKLRHRGAVPQTDRRRRLILAGTRLVTLSLPRAERPNRLTISHCQRPLS